MILFILCKGNQKMCSFGEKKVCEIRKCCAPDPSAKFPEQICVFYLLCYTVPVR